MAEVVGSLGVSPRDRLQVPSEDDFPRVRVSSTPLRRMERLLADRGRSLELQLYEFILFVCVAKGDEIAIKTLNRLSSQLAESFSTIKTHPFTSERISLNRRQIKLFGAEFIDLSEIESDSDTISLTHLTDIGLDLKELVHLIQISIHTPHRFFACKMRALLEESQDVVEEEGPRRKRQKTDPRSNALEITVTAPSGETEILLSHGG